MTASTASLFNPCTAGVSCPGGNCVGCQNGALWCQDPKCDPRCPDCLYDPIEEGFGSLTIVIIIVFILLIIFAVWMMIGHQMVYYYVPNYELDNKGYIVPEGSNIKY